MSAALPPGFQIVRMGEGHIDRVAELERICFPVPWTRRMVAGELKNPVARYFALERESVCIGYAGMHLVAGEGYITNIAVDPSYRRAGLGRALLETLVECGRRRAADFLTLEVRQSNLTAQELYRSMGFAEAGVRRGYYDKPKEDAILMTRVLHDDPGF